MKFMPLAGQTLGVSLPALAIPRYRIGPSGEGVLENDLKTHLGVCSAGRCGGCVGSERKDRRV
jgi:hypothetical protein